jgi:hypothetical protein
VLSAPEGEGGISLLDMQAQNEAIQVMWLKKYIVLGPQRPMWALVADVLIEESIAVSAHVDKEVATNTYLQSRSPMTDSRSKLPADIKKMQTVGKKYNLNLEALRIPEEVKKELPAWYHLGAESNPAGFNQSNAPKCLKNNHQVKTVGNLLKMTNQLRRNDPHDFHQDLRQCQCTSCEQDQLDAKPQTSTVKLHVAELKT